MHEMVDERLDELAVQALDMRMDGMIGYAGPFGRGQVIIEEICMSRPKQVALGFEHIFPEETQLLERGQSRFVGFLVRFAEILIGFGDAVVSLNDYRIKFF